MILRTLQWVFILFLWVGKAQQGGGTVYINTFLGFGCESLGQIQSIQSYPLNQCIVLYSDGPMGTKTPSSSILLSVSPGNPGYLMQAVYPVNNYDCNGSPSPSPVPFYPPGVPPGSNNNVMGQCILLNTSNLVQSIKYTQQPEGSQLIPPPNLFSGTMQVVQYSSVMPAGGMTCDAHDTAPQYVRLTPINMCVYDPDTDTSSMSVCVNGVVRSRSYSDTACQIHSSTAIQNSDCYTSPLVPCMTPQCYGNFAATSCTTGTAAISTGSTGTEWAYVANYANSNCEGPIFNQTGFPLSQCMQNVDPITLIPDGSGSFKYECDSSKGALVTLYTYIDNSCSTTPVASVFFGCQLNLDAETSSQWKSSMPFCSANIPDGLGYSSLTYTNPDCTGSITKFSSQSLGTINVTNSGSAPYLKTTTCSAKGVQITKTPAPGYTSLFPYSFSYEEIQSGGCSAAYTWGSCDQPTPALTDGVETYTLTGQDVAGVVVGVLIGVSICMFISVLIGRASMQQLPFRPESSNEKSTQIDGNKKSSYDMENPMRGAEKNRASM